MFNFGDTTLAKAVRYIRRHCLDKGSAMFSRYDHEAAWFVPCSYQYDHEAAWTVSPLRGHTGSHSRYRVIGVPVDVLVVHATLAKVVGNVQTQSYILP